MSNLKYKIGVQYLNAYPELRNILNMTTNAEYLLIDDKYKRIRKLKARFRRYSKLKKYLKPILIQKNKDRYLFQTSKEYNQIDFFHFFNTLNLKAKKPWGVTFETLLPSFEPFTDFHKKDFLNGNQSALKGIKKYLKTLSNDQCKFIIPISNCTSKIFESKLEYYPEYKEKITSKIKILHPPQKPLIDLANLPKNKDYKTVRFLFVGSDLTGKGGVEVINVFKKIDKRYKNYHLDIVGKINPNSFYSSNMSKLELDELNRFFTSKHERVTCYESIPNLDLLKRIVEKVDVGLLPTRSDTYGYSVLEFQSAGCPVISTDCRALPEINNNDCGWLINVDKNKFNETYHFEKEDLDKIQFQIESQLEPILIEILENPKVIESKSLKSLQRIINEHSVNNYKLELEKIYNKILE